MAKFRNISTTFWTDTKVSEDMSSDERYLFLYALTNPLTNLCGCYEIGVRQMVYDTGLSADKVKKLIHSLETKHNVIRYSDRTKELLIVNWHKHNWTSSDKFRKPLGVQISQIKDNNFRTYLIDVYNGMDTVSIPAEYGIDTTEEYTEEYSEENTVEEPDKRKRFSAPSVEEVRQYCAERQNTVDPQCFVDFYASKGWKVGNQPMKDWKACVRTWERNRNKDAPKSGSDKIRQINQTIGRTGSAKEQNDALVRQILAGGA